METATAKKLQEEITETFLKIVYGEKYLSPLKKKRIDDFWDFCHATFWPCQNFTDAEKEKFRELIAEHFTGDPDEKFLELIERAILVKRYIRRGFGRFVASPIDWLDIRYSYGLTGTAPWRNDMMERRKTLPHYNDSVVFLALSILIFCENKSTGTVEKVRDTLIKSKNYDLLNIYNRAIIHFLFIN